MYNVVKYCKYERVLAGGGLFLCQEMGGLYFVFFKNGTVINFYVLEGLTATYDGG